MAILIVEISKTCILAFYCKKKGKKNWRPQIKTWRPKILVKSPHGDHVKKLISDPVWQVLDRSETGRCER